MTQISFGVEVPFAQHLGCELVVFEGGRAEIHLPPKPELLNSFAVTHGGVLMTLLDVAMATAARSMCPEMGVVTIEMKTSFLRPALPSERGPLVAKGETLHRTATLAFTQASVFDARGHLCAHATGTFKYLNRLGAGVRSAKAAQVATD